MVTRRLERLEQMRGTSVRRARLRVAQICEQGDPRTSPDFAYLAPEWQRRIAWLYDVWQDNPAAFVEGLAHPRFAPEPPLPATPLFPDEEDLHACDTTSTAD